MEFFYGLAKRGNGGCGVCLKINSEHLIHLWMGCVCATNIKFELLAFWCLLHLAWTIGIPKF